MTVQNEDVKSKAQEYLKMASLEDVAACDSWEDGKARMSVKRTRSRRRPIDILPRKRVREIIAENVSLIRTVGTEMHPLIADKIYRLLKQRSDPEKFVDWMIDECNVSEGRAYLIATDQIRKALERVKVEYWKNKGVRYVVWHHKDDDDPREYHIDDWDGMSGIQDGRPNGLNGFVFDIERPPVIDKETGKRGMPSDLIGCKCFLTGIRGD